MYFLQTVAIYKVEEQKVKSNAWLITMLDINHCSFIYA